MPARDPGRRRSTITVVIPCSAIHPAATSVSRDAMPRRWWGGSTASMEISPIRSASCSRGEARDHAVDLGDPDGDVVGVTHGLHGGGLGHPPVRVLRLEDPGPAQHAFQRGEHRLPRPQRQRHHGLAVAGCQRSDRRLHARSVAATRPGGQAIPPPSVHPDNLPVRDEFGPTGHGALHRTRHDAGTGGAGTAPAILHEIALAHDATVGQIALAWVHHRQPVHDVAVVPLPGTTRVSHVRPNLAAAEIALSDEVLGQLDALGAPDRNH